MKVTVNVDLTPEEARTAMGLPDLSPIHDAYVTKVKRMLEEGITPDTLETMMRSWSPMGDTGMTIWRQLMDQMSGKAKG